jgi:deoxynucleoside triphosphate triphosphohydrolase SAMHD1
MDAAEGLERLVKEDIIVVYSPMHYGMKDLNPMKFIKFYTERDPTSCKYPLTPPVSFIFIPPLSYFSSFLFLLYFYPSFTLYLYFVIAMSELI